MTDQPIEQQVKDIISERFGNKPEEVTLSARLKNDLGADELDMVELTMAIEETFNLSISDEDAEEWGTVGDIVNYVREKKGKE